MAEPKKEVELTKKGETFKVRPGAYHRATGIPEDEKIPMSRINADIKKGGKIGRMARSAKGFRAMHHEDTTKEKKPRGKWSWKKGNGKGGKWSYQPSSKSEKEEGYDANGYSYARQMNEKEHPGGAKGTVRGHKTTAKQQKLFGIARGMQKGKTSPGYSPQAAEIAGHMSSKETKKVASKPKGGHRPSPSESRQQRQQFRNESVLMREAEERVMQLVREEEERQEREKNGNNGVPFKKRIPVGTRHPGEAGKTSQKGKPTWFGSGHRSSSANLHQKGGD